MKRNFFFCCLFAMSFSLTSVADVWQDPEYKVNYEYTPGSGKAEVKAGDLYPNENASTSGSPLATGNVQIRSEFVVDKKKYIVEGVGRGAFFKCESIYSVLIPEGVKSIGDYAFKKCSNLKSIYIPQTLTLFGYDSFFGCSSLSAIYIDDLKAWCNISFFDNPLKEARHLYLKNEEVIDVDIPEGVTHISNTFSGGEYLTSIRIPRSLNQIGFSTFSGCRNLTKVYISDLEAWCNINFDELSDPFECDHHIYLNGEEITDLIIPETITELKHKVFYGCLGLTHVTFGKNVQKIGHHAFTGCNGMESLMIPKSVEIIGEAAFEGCGNIRSIVVDEENKSYDSRDNCNALIQTKDNLLIKGCQNTVIPNSVTTIGSSAFKDCTNLTSVTIPSSITGIGNSAFAGCRNISLITSLIEEPFPLNYFNYEWPFEETVIYSARLYVPESSVDKYKATKGWNEFEDVRAIPNDTNNIYIDPNTNISYIIDESNLTAAVSENQSRGLAGDLKIVSDFSKDGKKYNVTTINRNAFLGCDKITSIDISEGISTIEESAFKGCVNLRTITIPQSIRSMRSDFRDCDNLQSTVILCPTIESWFAYNKSIKEVIIGGDSETIKNGAFSNCSGLEIVEIKGHVTNIGQNAFSFCTSLTSVTLPEGLEQIDFYAFYECTGLTKISLPNSLQSIEGRAFANCIGLTEVTIPENVNYIGAGVFHCCENINKVTSYIRNPFVVDGSVFHFPSATIYEPTARLYVPIESVEKYRVTSGWGWGSFKQISAISDHVIIDENEISYECYDENSTAYVKENQSEGLSGTINIKEIVSCEGRDYKVVGLSDYAFSGCKNISSIVIPDGITDIGEYAFKGCSNLVSVNIHEGVKSIGKGAFDGCTNIPVENGIRYAGTCALGVTDETQQSYTLREGTTFLFETFSGCSRLKSMILPSSLKVIGCSVFDECSGLTSIDIPEGVTAIGYGAFASCYNLASVSIPSSVSKIGEFAFNGCLSLTSITIPEGLARIERTTFGACVCLSTISIPNGVTIINESAFFNCSGLKSIAIPEGVTRIGSRAFEDCTNLTSVTIPSSVTSIGNWTFSGCSSLTSVTINCPYVGDWFPGLTSIKTVVLGKGVTTIGQYAFRECSGLTSVIIPEGVITIEPYAFRNCSNLSSIMLPESITTIGSDAFEGCTGFTSFVIPKNVSSIGRWAFEDCSNLTSISISCPSVGQWFEGVHSLKEVLLKKGVKTIEDCAFRYCSSLDSITIPKGVTSIGSFAFENCSALTSVTIPKGVTTIGYAAFDGCSSLTSITIPSSVTSIGDAGLGFDDITGYAFAGCTNLKSITSKMWTPVEVYFPQSTFTNATLYVPYGTKGFYNEIEDWKYFKNIIEIEAEFVALTINVTDEKGTDITNFVNIVWYNDEGKQIGVGRSLNGVADSTVVYFSVILDENLGRIYHEVTMQKVIVGDKDETITCQLEKIGRVTLEGRVSAADIDKNTMTVNVKQMLNGKWEEAYQTQTNEQGVFKVEVYDDETDITISGEGYFDATLHRDGFSGNGNVGTIPVNLISGFAIAPNITMQKAVAEGVVEEVTTWTNGLNNIEFTLTNTTKGATITDFTVQNGNVIIKTGAGVGDEICLVTKSKQGIFADATTTFTIVEGANAFDLHLTELGGLDATCAVSNNGSTLGYLYNSDDMLVAKGSYAGETLSLRHLKSGTYTLISMGNSTLLGSMTRLSDFVAVGMKEGMDYVSSSIDVVDGELAAVNINEVPKLDETPFYYTNKNTYFCVNKPTVTAGNYVTLSAHVDFKPEYADKVDNITLYIDLPEGCEMVENSLVANRKTIAYTLNGSRLTMLLSKEEYESQVRFCVIPTLNQSYTLTAMASFDIDGQVTQPIGTAQFEAKGLTLSVLEKTARTNVTINGTAKEHSEVNIYDNDVLIGKTSSKADGSWTAKCELYKPYSHSFHDIYAKITTGTGMELTSETRQVEYDKNDNIPEKVTMLYNSNKSEFDLLQGTTSPSYYSYVPGIHDFTFLASFTRNDSTQIKNVNIKVLNSDGTVRTLPATFDGKQNKWVATTKYSSSSRLPRNVAVEYYYNEVSTIDDTERSNDEYINIENAYSKLESYVEDYFDINILSDEDDIARLGILDNKTDMYHSIKVELLNPNEQIIDEYVYIKDTENEINYYLKETLNGDTFEAVIIEEDFSSAYRLRLDLQTHLGTRNNMKRGPLAQAGEFAANAFIPYYEYCSGVIDYNYWKSKLQKDDYDIENERNKAFRLLMATCPDGKSKLPSAWMSVFSEKYKDLCSDHNKFTNIGYDLLESWRIELLKQFAFETATIGLGKALKAIPNIKVFYKNSRNSGAMGYLVKGGCKNRERAEAMIENSVNQLGAGLGMIFPDGSISEKLSEWEQNKKAYLIRQFGSLQSDIRNKYQKCEKEEENEEEKKDDPRDEKSDNNNDFKGKGSTPQIDPSGYVYEAVTSNRLEGVTVTCYQNINGEDMYGEPTEEAVVWNAEDFSQHNPLQTDATGFYQWDVPQGLWQVKYEKEGYETTYSDWLPVPPPQLDVNVGMKQSTPPTVKQMRGYESGITIDLSKYMRPETMTVENITVTRNGSKETGGIEMVNAEKAPLGEETFVSKVKFVPKKRFNTSDNVVVTVHKEVESYCNVQMTADHVEVVKIEPEVKSIEVDSILTVYYQGEKELRVQVLPKEASAGKTLRVRTSSGMIASVSATEITINKDGVATLTLGGELPGGAVLDFSVDGTDVSATSKVKVIIREMVEAPIASIVSGEVFIGTEIELSCETEDVTIYYTLDGSCPCENSPYRKVYDGTPIVINENTIIKAMAVTSDGSESDVAEFTYTIIGDEDAIINAPSTTTKGKDEYDTSGRKAGNKAKGVIIRKNDGTSRKVLVK